MAKYKPYDYSQSLLIPVSLHEQLMPGTYEFAIHTLMEGRMDMSVFDTKYQNDDTGRRAYDPKILLNVVLLAYFRGLISSRQIERACCENVTFMAMLCNLRHMRYGHLFQNRYKTIVCEEDPYFKELVRYIHLNP